MKTIKMMALVSFICLTVACGDEASFDCSSDDSNMELPPAPPEVTLDAVEVVDGDAIFSFEIKQTTGYGFCQIQRKLDSGADDFHFVNSPERAFPCGDGHWSGFHAGRLGEIGSTQTVRVLYLGGDWMVESNRVSFQVR